MDSHPQGLLFLGVSLLLAILLSIVPLSGALAWLRPDWLLLILLYWLLAIPERVGIALCWTCGLVQDILFGSVLGQNAFSLAVIAYMVQISYQQLRMFSLRKQAALIALLELFRILVDQWAQSLNGLSQTHWLVFLPILPTALLWLLLRPTMAWWQRVFMAN
ncbi:rod shape-determining protein MreD [Spongiibacter sp.]|uniref:rod shape-determining protein MreD n=1 Tax=Spongiibacter sp. TaxID=2024860 RepID=UPI003563C4F1